MSEQPAEALSVDGEVDACASARRSDRRASPETGLRRELSLVEGLLGLLVAPMPMVIDSSANGSFSVLRVVIAFAAASLALPFATLGHELGHALAALSRGRPSAHVIVGRAPKSSFTLGRITIAFTLLRTRGVNFNGLCLFESRGVGWADWLLIALAGPLATFAEIVGIAGFLIVVDPSAPLLRDSLWMTVALLTVGLARNLDVRHKPPPSAGSVGPADGVLALEAWRLRHASWPSPAAQHAAPPHADRPASTPSPGWREP